MKFSSYLESRRKSALEIVSALGKEYREVSVLGNHVISTNYVADKNTISINSSRDEECGFVIKVNNGKQFFEYSTNDIANVEEILAEVNDGVKVTDGKSLKTISINEMDNEKIKKSFSRESDILSYDDDTVINEIVNIKNKSLASSDKVINSMVRVNKMNVSKLFISKTKELDQTYGWAVGSLGVVLKDNGKITSARYSSDKQNLNEVFKDLYDNIASTTEKGLHLLTAKPIEPGFYDVITAPSITGLIAHEAFGHGVEMDQFVKDRALAKEYVNDYVASPIVNMRDGAASLLGLPSYFFDDNGVFASDTQIIKDGILVTGISDETSARMLNMKPTGNGRRESFERKAYSRMTSTFIEKGESKLSDMIKSIKHGYMLFETNNGMEDPKNWAIQCVCSYGIEIVDGKLTENYVSPVVMSGYVPDLLKSISMVSDDFEMSGSGMCGKGYKEWVRVADGGPYLKAKVKLS